MFDSIRKMQLHDWEFKLSFIYIAYWHNRDLKLKRRKILRCTSFCNQNKRTFKNSMNALNDSIQNTHVINTELIDSVSGINNHKSNGSLDNFIKAKHHQGSIADNNDYVMMQGNSATCQTSHGCCAKTDEERDFYKNKNQHTTGNKNRNRNRYHNNSHNDKQRRNRVKKINGFALFYTRCIIITRQILLLKEKKNAAVDEQ